MLRNIDTDDRWMYGGVAALSIVAGIVCGPDLIQAMNRQNRIQSIVRDTSKEAAAAVALAGNCTTGAILSRGDQLQVGTTLLAVETSQPFPSGTVVCLETGHVATIGQDGVIAELLFSAQLRDHYKKKGFARQNEYELWKRGGVR